MTTSKLSTSKLSTSTLPRASMEALHALQELARQDPRFARSLKHAGSTQAAVKLAHRKGISITADTLWRNRGRHGLPTWRG
jgi:cobalamin biosynthesis protein CbiD